MRSFLALLMLGFLLFQGCSDQGTSTAPTPPTTPGASSTPDSLPLPARWWVWAESFAADSSPITDTTGVACGSNQPGDVWFLAGTFGGRVTRECTVPSGVPVYFPVLNQICLVEEGESATAALDRCTFVPDKTTASLDGRPLRVAESGTRESFIFDARQDSLTGFPQGPNEAVAWGMWVGPTTLEPGEHVLRFEGAVGSFSLGVTYRITVA